MPQVCLYRFTMGKILNLIFIVMFKGVLRSTYWYNSLVTGDQICCCDMSGLIICTPYIKGKFN